MTAIAHIRRTQIRILYAFIYILNLFVIFVLPRDDIVLTLVINLNNGRAIYFARSMNNSHISTSSSILDSWKLYNLWIFSHERRLFWATHRLLFSSQEVLGYVDGCQCDVYLQKALGWKVNERKLRQANSLKWCVSSCGCCATITELQNKKKGSHQLWQTLPTPHIYTSNLPPTLVKTKYVILSTKHMRT